MLKLVIFTVKNNEIWNSRVTKQGYAKWRHTLSYLHEHFNKNSSFELLTRLHKNIKLNFELLTRRFNFYFPTFQLLTQSWKIKVDVWVTIAKIIVLFFYFRVTNSKLKNRKLHLELVTRSQKIKITTNYWLDSWNFLFH